MRSITYLRDEYDPDPAPIPFYEGQLVRVDAPHHPLHGQTLAVREIIDTETDCYGEFVLRIYAEGEGCGDEFEPSEIEAI